MFGVYGLELVPDPNLGFADLRVPDPDQSLGFPDLPSKVRPRRYSPIFGESGIEMDTSL